MLGSTHAWVHAMEKGLYHNGLGGRFYGSYSRVQVPLHGLEGVAVDVVRDDDVRHAIYQRPL